MNPPIARSLSRSFMVHAVLAVAIFFLVFSPWLLRAERFWFAMTLAVLGLNALAWRTDRDMIRLLVEDTRAGIGWKILMGLASAGALYGVFVFGRWFVLRFLPGAAGNIAAVYQLREGRSLHLIATALVLIGTAEELFWRQHLQRMAAVRWGTGMAVLVQSGIYALAHAGSRNLTLVAAAGVAGLFWGATYARWRSPLLNMISHVTWDLLVFLVFPFKV